RWTHGRNVDLVTQCDLDAEQAVELQQHRQRQHQRPGRLRGHYRDLLLPLAVPRRLGRGAVALDHQPDRLGTGGLGMARLAHLRSLALAVWRREAGSAAAEFALLLPGMLFLVFGVINLSLLTFAAANLHAATEAAARYGSVTAAASS